MLVRRRVESLVVGRSDTILAIQSVVKLIITVLLKGVAEFACLCVAVAVVDDAGVDEGSYVDNPGEYQRLFIRNNAQIASIEAGNAEHTKIPQPPQVHSEAPGLPSYPIRRRSSADS